VLGHAEPDIRPDIDIENVPKLEPINIAESLSNDAKFERSKELKVATSYEIDWK
jgi:hypothetical protein